MDYLRCSEYISRAGVVSESLIVREKCLIIRLCQRFNIWKSFHHAVEEINYTTRLSLLEKDFGEPNTIGEIILFFSDTDFRTFVTKSTKSLEGKSIPQGYFQRFAKGHSFLLALVQQRKLLFITTRKFSFSGKFLDSAFPPNPRFTVFVLISPFIFPPR